MKEYHAAITRAHEVAGAHRESIISVSLLLYIAAYLLFGVGSLVFPVQPALASYHIPTVGERIALPSGPTTIQLGDSREIPVRLTNPMDRADVYALSTEMSPVGVAKASLISGSESANGTETLQVEMPPDSTKTIGLVVRGASCYGSSCSATVTVRGDALRAGTQMVATTDVVVQRNTEIHRAPGITLPYMVVALLTAVFIYWFRG